MEPKLVLAYDRPADIGALFSEYTRMLVTEDPAFAAYLELQNYDEELRHLEGKYGLPDGRLYLALVDGTPAGCIALRKLDETRCELKRLYVRPAFRGQGLARLLTEQILRDARAIGYRKILLDTLPFLESAIRLYRSLGCTDAPPATTILPWIPPYFCSWTCEVRCPVPAWKI